MIVGTPSFTDLSLWDSFTEKNHSSNLQQRFNAACFAPSGPTTVYETQGLINDLALVVMAFVIMVLFRWYSFEYLFYFREEPAWNATLFLSRVRKPQRGKLFTFLFSKQLFFRETWWKQKGSLSGPDRGQCNGRDYEQQRGEEAWGGEGRIVLCNHLDPRWLSSIPLIKFWGDGGGVHSVGWGLCL